MSKITEEDFEKIRKWVSIMNLPPDPHRDPYTVRQKPYEEAKPAATFLIQYHFKFIDHDDGEKSVISSGPRPYGSTVTERAIIALNNGFDVYGSFGEKFLEKYPTLLENAIVHYKSKREERLTKALSTSLSEMTGEQFLVLLQEYRRRDSEGFPLMMPTQEGDSKPTLAYINPYSVLKGIDEVINADQERTK